MDALRKIQVPGDIFTIKSTLLGLISDSHGDPQKRIFSEI